MKVMEHLKSIHQIQKFIGKDKYLTDAEKGEKDR